MKRNRIASAPPGPDPRPSTSRRRRPLRVVLVDDVAALRRFVGAVARKAGCEIVGEAADGREGVTVTMAHEPDVVIMDWDMPELDGVQATRAILARRPVTSVIGFSSAGDPAVREAFLKAGAVAFVDKGDVVGLAGAVARVAGRA